MFDFGTIASIAGPIIGGMMQSDSASEAAGIQSAATDRAAQATLQAQREATAELRRQYDTTRADFSPFRDVGVSSIRTLARLMGLPSSVVSGATSAPAAMPSRSWDSFYQEALARAPRAQQRGTMYVDPGFEGQGGSVYYLDENGNVVPTVSQGPDESWARAEADRMFASQPTTTAAPAAEVTAAEPGDVLNAPLNRKFTMADFWADPVVQAGYQSGLDRGIKGINLGAGAAGLRNSGQTLKALTKFGTDYTGGMANDSRNRFVDDQTTVFNRLSGMAGSGQAATGSIASAGQGMAGGIAGINTGTGNTMANLYSNLGNARGAAAIAGGNAFGNAFNTIGNWWQQKNMMDRMFPAAGGGGGASSGMGGMPFFGGLT